MRYRVKHLFTKDKYYKADWWLVLCVDDDGNETVIKRLSFPGAKKEALRMKFELESQE